MQYLYLREVNGECDIESFYKFRGLSPAARKFTAALVVGTTEHQAAVDEIIRANAKNYELHRISAVDRNVLRVAIYELQFAPDTPPVVAINEAIEIAKKYSTEESGRFVNGVLDQIRSTLKRPTRTSTEA